MKRLLIATVVAFGFTTPALAAHCPKDVKLIDAALSKQKNTAAKTLRDQGDSQHKSGQHKESLASLHKAMEILSIKH